MESREAEIEKFKMQINLIEFAERHGFEIDFEKCTTGSVHHAKNVVMKGGGDTILVSKDSASGVWLYWDTARDTATHSKVGGDIVDFVQWQKPELSRNIGKVRVVLREYMGTNHAPITQSHTKKASPQKNFEYVRKFLDERQHAQTSSYLEGRGISKETLNNPLFSRRILKGFEGAVIFPHHNESGACGYEVRSDTIRLFTDKGVKGLWYSQIPVQVGKIVFTESSIEALSHFQLHQPKNTAYFSAGGNWNVETVGRLIEKVMHKYAGAEIVAAYNNDRGGHTQADKLEIHAHAVNRSVKREFPPLAGQDWNDLVRGVASEPGQDLKKKRTVSLSRSI